MKTQLLQTLAVTTGLVLIGLATASPSEARSHVSVNLGVGVGPYWGGGPYYRPYWDRPYWGPRYYGSAYYYPYRYYYRPYYDYTYAPSPPARTPYYGAGISATAGLDLFPA